MRGPASWRTKVAFQGEPGSFTEEGVLAAFAKPEMTALPTWHAVFEAVNDGTVDAGVVPIERSSGGSVREIYDLLFKFDEVRIVAEVTVPVRLALLALPGQTLDKIERVYSIAQALDQADEFLRSRPWQVMTSYNTAGAAKAIADKHEMGAAAMASARVAALYGLEVLADNIQSGEANRTRFAVLASRYAAGLGVHTGDARRSDEDDAGLGRPQRSGQSVPLPRLLRRTQDQPVAPGVTAEPRSPLGVCLLGGPRRRSRNRRTAPRRCRRCSARRSWSGSPASTTAPSRIAGLPAPCFVGLCAPRLRTLKAKLAWLALAPVLESSFAWLCASHCIRRPGDLVRAAPAPCYRRMR